VVGYLFFWVEPKNRLNRSCDGIKFSARVYATNVYFLVQK